MSFQKYTINLPNNYQIPNSIKNITPIGWTHVFDLLGNFIDNFYDDFSENFEKNKHIETSEKNQKRSNENNEEKSFLIEDLKNKLFLSKQLEEQYQISINSKDELIKQLRLQSSEYAKIEQLITPIVHFYSKDKAIDKGNDGEHKITELLYEFEDGIIHDKSGSPHCGDIWFYYKHMKILIEVKNKKQLTADDIEKFQKDVKNNADSGHINCGLFISLLDDKFPNKKRRNIQYELFDDCYLVYIYLDNKSNIKSGIYLLEELLNKNPHIMEKTYKKEYSEFLEDQIDCIFKNIKKEEKLIKKYQSLLKNI